MDKETIARAAGIDRAWAGHRAEVEEAIDAALRLRTAFARPAAPEAEPMPPYRAPPARPRAPEGSR